MRERKCEREGVCVRRPGAAVNLVPSGGADIPTAAPNSLFYAHNMNFQLAIAVSV